MRVNNHQRPPITPPSGHASSIPNRVVVGATRGLATRDQRPTTRDRSRRPRGFTLIELLVVLAVTSVLMVMLFAPLSRALDLVARGNATAAGQDAVRHASQLMSSEMANAMEVYEPRALRMWGYSAWDASGKLRPANGAVTEGYDVPNGVFAFRLPKHRYYCSEFSHYVTQGDVEGLYGVGVPYDLVALGDCPRHPGSPVTFRPTLPLEAEDTIVVYYTGLKNPKLRDSAGKPVYDNLLLFKTNGPAVYEADDSKNTLNTYGLYRVEFSPRAGNGDPDSDGNGLDDRWEGFTGANYDPNFLYDTTVVAGQPRWQWWTSRRRAVMANETADAIRWVQSAGKYLPQPLCTVTPASVSTETAQPNRNTAQYLLSGSALTPYLPSLEYNLDHGQWTGATSTLTNPSVPLGDGTTLLPEGTDLGPGRSTPGPQIQVLQGGTLVYDSTSITPALRSRLVSYDSLTGRVLFGIRREDDTVPVSNALDRYYYSGDITSTASDLYTVDLAQDEKSFTPTPLAGLPSSFGYAKNTWVGMGANRSVMIVPGSEQVQLVSGTAPTQTVIRLNRAGWTGLTTFLAGLDHDVSQLQPDEYKIDYVSGLITLPENGPTDTPAWGDVGPSGKTWQFRVAYSFQTNQQRDVVRVSYSTKELAEVKTGIVEYTRGRQESLPFETSQKVNMPNTRR